MAMAAERAASAPYILKLNQWEQGPAGRGAYRYFSLLKQLKEQVQRIGARSQLRDSARRSILRSPGSLQKLFGPPATNEREPFGLGFPLPGNRSGQCFQIGFVENDFHIPKRHSQARGGH